MSNYGLIAFVLLASPLAASRVISLRANNASSQSMDSQMALVLSMAASCKCHFRNECTCPAVMEFMDCISTACNSGECDCHEQQFQHACLAMGATCPDAKMTCEAEKAQCLYRHEATEPPVPSLPTHPPKAQAVATEPVAEKIEKVVEEEIGTMCDEWKWLPLVSWIVLAAVTAVLYVLKKGPLKKQRHFVAAGLVVLWGALVFATLFWFLSSHKWTFLESLYFSVTTISTVGYGDYVPYLTTADKIAGIVFIWFVVGILATALSIVTSEVSDDVDGEPKVKGAPLKQAVLHLGIIVGLLVIGMLVFSYLEGWSHFDAFFFSLVTLSTVGYGSHEVSTCGGMWAAIVYMLCAVPVFGAFMGSLGSHLDAVLAPRKAKMTQMNIASACVALIVGWLLIGATGVHFFNTHNWSWPTCLYFCAVTMTTVGYGDFVPVNSIGDKVLCLVYIVLSVVVIATVFGDLNAIVISSLTAGMKQARAMAVQGGLLLAIVIGGGLLFATVEGWPILNGFFYTSVTCTTVGYGHLLPSDTTSRMIATVFILLTVPMTGALVSNISGQYQDKIQKIFGI